MKKKTGEDCCQSFFFFPPIHRIWRHLCISRGAVVKVCQVREVVKPPLLCVSFLLLGAVRKRLGLGKCDHSDAKWPFPSHSSSGPSRSLLPQLSAEGLPRWRLWSCRPTSRGGPWLAKSCCRRPSTTHSHAWHLLGHLSVKRKKRGGWGWWLVECSNCQ